MAGLQVVDLAQFSGNDADYIDDITGDGGVLKDVLKPGAGDELGPYPPVPSRVKVRHTTTVDDAARTAVDAGVVEFHLGDDERVPRGWHKGVRTMRKGEEAELILAPAYAHGAAGRPPSVPEGASVRCRLELLAWTAPRKEAHELTLDEALAEAATLKAKGTDAFKGGAWAEARGAYERAAGLLAEREEGWGGEAPLEDDSPARALLLSCWLNAAQCALKLEEWYGARDAAGKALALDGASVKALFRRGRALMALGEFGAAKGDLREANRLDPKSREVREAWEACAAAEAAAEGEEKRLASRMAARMVRAVAPAAAVRANRRVWLDVSVDGAAAGRVVIELFSDEVPRAAENFRALCTGEFGVAISDGATPLCYRGSRFVRALSCDTSASAPIFESNDQGARQFKPWDGLLVHGGDNVRGGAGDGPGESIYGGPFEDEASARTFSEPGLVAMAAAAPPRDAARAAAAAHAPHRNGSSFLITTKAAPAALGGERIPHLDGRHVIVGKVSKGIDVVRKIQKARLADGAAADGRLAAAVVITDCGELSDAAGQPPRSAFARGADAAAAVREAAAAERAARLPTLLRGTGQMAGRKVVSRAVQL